MSALREQFATVRRHNSHRSAFSLIELLVVMAIISVMTAILLPALTRAREQGRIASCLSNMKQVGTGLIMYMQDSSEQVPWINPHPQATWVSPFAWGGFVAPTPSNYFGNDVDYVLHPAESRPLNPYIAPGANGGDVIPTYICPSDNFAPFARSNTGGQGGRWFTTAEWSSDTNAAWKGAGNSYAVNWWWMNYYYPSGSWTIDQIAPLSHKLIKRNLGGQGSAFVVATEATMHALLADARAGAGGAQSSGWHGNFSRHSLLFFDGHSEYRFVDSRYPFGDGWSIWPSPN